MDRRTALGTLAVLGAVPLWALAEAKTVRIGGLSLDTAAGFKPRREAFVRSLAALGWKEGPRVRFDWRHAGGDPDRLPRLAQELAAARPDVLLSESTPTSLALRATGTAIPVVMGTSDDPVRSRLVRALEKPETAFTGLVAGGADQGLAMAELLVSVVPKGSRIAGLLDPGNALYRALRARLHVVAQQAGAEIEYADAVKDDPVERILERLARAGVRGVVVMNDALFHAQRDRIVRAVSAARLVAVYPDRSYVEAGGLMSQGPDLVASFARAAGFVDRILRGAAAGALPIEAAGPFELAVNRATARAQRIALPRSVLDRARMVA